METMHAGRRSLPPVPRSDRDAAPAERTVVDPAPGQSDAAQQFVARLRAAATAFAGAAGAESAVVREAVPPPPHRRALCPPPRPSPANPEADVPSPARAGNPGPPPRHGFDRQIRRWLGAGLAREQGRDEAW